MDKLLTILIFVLAVGVMFFTFPDGPLAVLFCSGCSIAALLFINRIFDGKEKIFVRRVFLVGLVLRVLLATVTYVFELQGFFGGDSITYSEGGFSLYNSWFNNVTGNDAFYTNYVTQASGSGWGMAYIVAAIYTLTAGKNPFAIQLFNCVLGATTAVFVYICAKKIFLNSRVARHAAIFVAIFPSLIVWSSQGLKDGVICFLLALAINSVLTLQKNFSYRHILLLLFSLSSIYTLRFYIFFAFIVAIVGAFFIGAQKSIASVAQQLVILIVITLGLTYLGVLRNAETNLQRYGSLETLQNSRLDQAQSAESGFGQDIDVSTPEGAIQVLPIGLTYIMLAPFPWEVSNFRQAIVLPEVFAWWACIPFMIMGIVYTLKNKLRESISITLLTLLLTIAYSIFQGNVGTAYRMRAQMQIFYFIFVAVGFVIWQEKRENQMLAKNKARQALQNNAFAKQ